MIGTWQVQSYYDNGADQTAFFQSVYVNYKIKFSASGDYLETSTVLGSPVTNGGPWELINNGDDLKLTNQSDNSVRYFHTTRSARPTSSVDVIPSASSVPISLSLSTWFFGQPNVSMKKR